MNGERAIRAGLAMGAAVAAGLDVEPILDELGNYTPEFYITVDTDLIPDRRIKVVVQ